VKVAALAAADSLTVSARALVRKQLAASAENVAALQTVVRSVRAAADSLEGVLAASCHTQDLIEAILPAPVVPDADLDDGTFTI
jgi:hypothetical protein